MPYFWLFWISNKIYNLGYGKIVNQGAKNLAKGKWAKLYKLQIFIQNFYLANN